MASINVSGLDVFMSKLQSLSNEAQNINKGALGEGAKAAAQEYRNALESLPERPDKPDHDHRLYGVTADEKAQLLDNFGIARFRNANGGWNTSIGIKGYVNTPSPMFGDQVPARLLLAAVDSGTEFRKPCHVMSKATKSMKAAVESAIQKYIDQETAKIMQ